MKNDFEMKIRSFWESNWYSKCLWILYWRDTWEEHQARYRNSKKFRKAIERIKENEPV